MSSWNKCWLVTFATLVIVATPSAAASQEAAKRYFQNGVDLITAEQPNYQDAYYQFQLAYQESSKSWKVLGNLGLCALKLERDQEAARYYEQYLKKGGSEIAPEERSAIERDLLLLRGNLATVRITSPVKDLQIVDRRAGSQAPAQSYSLQAGALELELRAGNHKISATNGERRLDWDVVLQPKMTAAHVFDFDAAAQEAPAHARVAPATLPDRPRRRGADLRIPAYVALGLGAVGTGLGGYFTWQSSDYAKRSEDAFACNMTGCTEAQKNEVRRLEDENSSASTRAIVAFSAGGAAIAAGIVLLVVSSSASDNTGQAINPWVGFREAGLSGRF